MQPLPGHRLSSAWTGGGDEDADSAVDPATGSTDCFRIGAGAAADISRSVGLVLRTPTRAPSSDPVVISGFVFHDVNGDGYLEDGEGDGLPGVRAALFGCGGSSPDAIISLTTTDANGMYGFEGLAAGSYAVKFSSPDDYRVSNVWAGQLDEEGTRLVAPDAENEADPATGSTSCEKYRLGDAAYSLDAGMYLPSSLEEEDATDVGRLVCSLLVNTSKTQTPTNAQRICLMQNLVQ